VCYLKTADGTENARLDFVNVDGVAIHVRTSGEAGAPPFVMVHAQGADLRVWGRLTGYLNDRLSLVRYDQRGHGLSALANPPYRLDDLVADAAGLMDHLDTGPAVVCGVSLGGLVAMGLALQRPELVRGLVLMNTSARIGTPAGWQERIAAVEAGGMTAITDAVLARWFPPVFHATRPEEIAGWRAMLTRTPAAGYAGACAVLRDADLGAAAADIRVPTLCLAGEHGGSVPLAEIESLAACIPGARLRLVQGAGHLPCVDQPAATAAAILTFLETEGLA
jgi:3-oxoadipate enol-lactonase